VHGPRNSCADPVQAAELTADRARHTVEAMKPRIIVAGLGETGTDLIHKLRLNWDVVGIDPDPAAVDLLYGAVDADGAVTLFHGDATSGLILRKASVEGAHGIVACTGDDEVNFEVLHLARHGYQIENRYALMYSLDWEERYKAEEIEVVSQDRACAAILESRVERGQKVATGVGLGHGEIVEVEVLPNSSVVNHTLAELRPRRWLVGAIYRDGQLIVPHGDTIIEPGDRVLLIGDPAMLPSIASLIRSGASEFPLQYGSHVVALRGPDVEHVVKEAAYLIRETRADRFEVVACAGDESRLRALTRKVERTEVPFEISCSAEEEMGSLVEEADRRDVGILVVPPEPLGLLKRLGLGRSRTAKMIDLVTSPVLMTRGTFPYRTVMLVLAELPFHPAAAQVAIDLARLLGAELQLGVVHQPDLVAGADLRGEVEARRREIENLAGMYHIEMNTRVMEGNPVEEVERASADVDLLVLPYRKGRKAFLTRPDVGLNLIHRARCSVMVMPH